MSTRKRKKAPAKRKQGREPTTRKPQAVQRASVSIPRPRVTEYNEITVVPVFPSGEAGPPSGASGSYEIVFILGVPGVSGVAMHLDWDGMLADGDSLLEGPGSQVDLQSPDGNSQHMARITPNPRGRLSQVRITIAADNFSHAEEMTFDLVMPMLSRIAFEADTPVEVTGVLLTERATQTRRFGATLAGSVQHSPQKLGGDVTPELRPFLAAYREGLNSNSPLYQTLSFYKVIEGVSKYHTRRVRAATRSGSVAPSDPMARQMPSNHGDLADMTDWARGNFTPYLGKTFGEIKSAVEHTIRDAVAHITPGLDLRIADYSADVRACRAVVPVLRYVARELIRDELTG